MKGVNVRDHVAITGVVRGIGVVPGHEAEIALVLRRGAPRERGYVDHLYLPISSRPLIPFVLGFVLRVLRLCAFAFFLVDQRSIAPTRRK